MIPRGAALVLAGLAWASVAHADAPRSVPHAGHRPPRVELLDNARPATAPARAPHPTPTLREVTPTALDSAMRRLDRALAFSDYPFSGCHDRAHLTYLGLARELGDDAVAKIWVFGPRLMTVALDGAIEAPVDEHRWGVDRTRWDFHVAVVARTPDGFAVVDPALEPGGHATPIDAWFSRFRIPAGSVYAIVDGAHYSFHTIGDAAWSGGRHPFNGGMFDYDRTAAAQRWLQRNLARDDVASALADAPSTCPTLQGSLVEPQALADRLAALSATAGPKDCRVYAELFDARVAHWSARLRELAADP